MAGRFTSPTLIFRVEGRCPCKGGRNTGLGRPRMKDAFKLSPKAKKEKIAEQNKAQRLNLAQYTNIIKLMAKTAIAEQGWELNDKPVYLVLTFYVNSEKQYAKKGVIQEIYRSDVPPTRTPLLHTVSKIFIRALEGIVYKKQLQIAGLLVLKRYTDGLECTDILVGQPSTYKELIYDLRNN